MKRIKKRFLIYELRELVRNGSEQLLCFDSPEDFFECVSKVAEEGDDVILFYTERTKQLFLREEGGLVILDNFVLGEHDGEKKN